MITISLNGFQVNETLVKSLGLKMEYNILKLSNMDILTKEDISYFLYTKHQSLKMELDHFEEMNECYMDEYAYTKIDGLNEEISLCLMDLDKIENKPQHSS